MAWAGLPPYEDVEGTAATMALGIQGGANIVRMHDVAQMVRVYDVAQMVRVVRVVDAIVRPSTWARLTDV